MLAMHFGAASNLMLLIFTLYVSWGFKTYRKLAAIILAETICVMGVQISSLYERPYDSPVEAWAAIYLVSALLAALMRQRVAYAFASIYVFAASLAVLDAFVSLPHGILTGALGVVSYLQIGIIILAPRRLGANHEH
jgi:hypothetical protein